jgi:iron complex outermembrane recepter protein
MCLKHAAHSVVSIVAMAVLIFGAAHAQAESQGQSAQTPQVRTPSANTQQAAHDPPQAQTASSDASLQLKEIVVTGTLITGIAAPVGSEIISVTPIEMQETGAISVISYLQTLPEVSSLGFNSLSPNGANNFQSSAGNDTFSQSINLRGIGSLDTLTLLNGTRVAPEETGNSTDIGEIPTNILQRVDVEADGSSATYGANAIAGTVNLIYRKPEDVNETTAQYGFSPGTSNWQVGQVIGKTWDASGLGQGGIIIAYQKTDDQPLYARNLSEYTSDISPEIGSAGLSPADASPGNVTGLGGPAGTAALYASPSGLAYNEGVTLAQLGPANQPNYTNDWYNTLALPQITQQNVAFNFRQTLMPWLTLYSNGFYSDRSAVGTNSVGGQENYTLTVPDTNPYSPCATAAAAASAGLPAPSPVNSQGLSCPANGTIHALYDFNNEAGGPALREGETWAYQWVTGFNVTLPFSWLANAFFDNSVERDSQDITNQINTNDLNQVLGQQVNGVYTKPSSVPFFNPFCTDTNGPCNPASTLEYIGIPNGFFGYRDINKLDEGNLTLSGPLVENPMAREKLRLAVGIDYLGESLYVNNPSDTGTADTSVIAPEASYESRITRAAFYELYLPVVKTAMPFLQKVDLDIGGRETKYSTGYSSFNQKLGLSWQLAEGFQLHGTWGTSFQAPDLRNASPIAGFGWYGGQLDCAQLVGCSGATDLDDLVAHGGNPFVAPETATTWTFGADWKPIPGFKASVSYFNIKIQNEIAQPIPLSSAGYLGAVNNPLLTPYVTFNPAYFPTRAVVTPYVQQYLSGQNLALGAPLTQAEFNAFVSALTSNPIYPAVSSTLNALPYAYVADDLFANTGGTDLDGIDFQVNYAFDTAWGGEAVFGATGTYNLAYKATLLNGTPFVEYVNDLGYPLRFRARFQAGLTYGPWTGNLFDNYENSFTVPPTELPVGTPVQYQHVDQWDTVDASLAYNFGEQTSFAPLHHMRLILSVTNLLDRAPPFVLTVGGPQYDPNTANPFGRSMQFQLMKEW